VSVTKYNRSLTRSRLGLHLPMTRFGGLWKPCRTGRISQGITHVATETDAVDVPEPSSLTDWVNVAREHWIALTVGVGLTAVAWGVLRAWLARRRVAPPPRDELIVDVSVLPDLPPPPGPPVLEFYHLPVRLVALVLAPVGHGRELPEDDELPEVVDSIVPGLDQVVAAHRPLVRHWPRQVSSRGFAHALFANLRLPGEPGQRSEWSAVAGLVHVGDETMMAGLVLRAASPNRFGNYVMERETDWLGILRVRLS